MFDRAAVEGHEVRGDISFLETSHMATICGAPAASATPAWDTIKIVSPNHCAALVVGQVPEISTVVRDPGIYKKL